MSLRHKPNFSIPKTAHLTNKITLLIFHLKEFSHLRDGLNNVFSRTNANQRSMKAQKIIFKNFNPLLRVLPFFSILFFLLQNLFFSKIPSLYPNC